jgi:hypothetical protein
MFAEMPLDNITVNKCRGHRRQTLTLPPSATYSPHGNDLKFRRS